MNKVAINIFGNNFEIEKEQVETEQFSQMSKILDQMMYRNARKMKNINPWDVSIMTAMRLLEDNFNLRKQLISHSMV